jgi:PAS domain S-box-containing protein
MAANPEQREGHLHSKRVPAAAMSDDFFAVFERAPVPIGVVRLRDRIVVAWNEAARALLQLPELPLGVSIGDCLEYPESLFGALANESALTEAECTLRLSADVRAVRVTASATFHEREPVAVLVFSSKIEIADAPPSSRRRPDHPTPERTRTLEWITNSVPGVVYQYRAAGDGSFGFSFVSEGVRELLGLSPEQVLGSFDAVWELVLPEDRRGLAESMQRSFEVLEPWQQEFRVESGGLTRWIRANAMPERQADGALVWHGLMMDVTEQRQLATQLQLADRLSSVGLLAAGVAHEINNPLAYISSNIAFALEALGGAETASTQELAHVLEALRDASEGTARVGEIVEHLSTFSRPTGAEVERPLDVHRVLDAAMRMTRNEVKHRGRLVQERGDVLPVRGTESGLVQVFVNLLVNACESLPERAQDRNTIHLRTLMQGSQVIVEVTDNGRGIPPEALARVFDPFFTTKPVGGGTGLGLTVAHNVVSSLGGEIVIESRLGYGTRVRVTLPSVAGETQRSSVAEAADREGRARVLVIDDERLVLNSLRRLLGREHDVVTCMSARDALERLDRGETFDVVLCDIMMPEMNGMELWNEVELRFPELAPHFFFLTGGAFTPALAQFRDLVAERVLSKPVDPGQLKRLVALALRRRRAERH